MTVRELTRAQLDELKTKYVCELYENPTYGDLADAHTICDEELFIHYEGINFVEEDFFCDKEDKEMTNVEFKKLLGEVFEGHRLMKNRDYHTVNELLHMLRYDDKLRELERVNINVIKADGSCLCIPSIDAFVDIKSLGVWFEDIAIEFEIEEFEVDDEMLKFSNITVYEKEVV